MSRLRESLQRLKTAKREAPAETASSSAASAASALPEAAVDEWSRIGAKQIRLPDGGGYVHRVIRKPLGAKHGRYAFEELRDGAIRRLHRLTGHAESDPPRLLFFDTETTGLGVGAGNVPFMIGLGYEEDDAFVVEQFFIRNPAEEAAMLAEFQRRLDRFDTVVSYNGKSFDWPVLRNRFVMNRLTLRDGHVRHLDCLYASRALWKHTLPTCRLGTVEDMQLGVKRLDDVPGSMAPVLYVQYLSEQNPDIVSGVFRHNELDILSLAGLAVHLSRLLEFGIGSGDPGLPTEELYRLVLWLDKHDRRELAEQAAKALLERPANERRPYVLPLAARYKKLGAWAQAAELWQSAIASVGAAGTSAEPWIELSMLYEHKYRKPDQAWEYANQAKEMLRRRMTLTRGDGYREQLGQIERRLERLTRKISKQSDERSSPGPLARNGRTNRASTQGIEQICF